MWSPKGRALAPGMNCFPVRARPSRQEHTAICTMSHAIFPTSASMGFDVLYLPPIHPIGQSDRKGKNNLSVRLPTIRGARGL